MIHKSHYYGIRGDLLQWIQCFLTNRTQRVAINGTCFSPCGVTSGVPQGSGLGPILFLIYVKDITSNIHSQVRLFADDCLVHCPINSPCRNLHHCPPHLKMHAYKQIVLPSIEYCSTIWDQNQQTSIHKLEMIQHRAARFVLNKPCMEEEL